MNRSQLEQCIREGIPIAAQMAFRVCSLSQSGITVIGGGEQNHNVHGSAFAGSLYAIGTLSAWGLVQSRLPKGAVLVMARGEIDYRQPVIGDIVAHCNIDRETFDSFLDDLQQRGRARLKALSIIGSDGSVAAEFSGLLHARLRQAAAGRD
ncbi:MAG: thioesterase domain-containing protein [Candidatus Thiodiazotropha sp. (ex Ctena orbiculata)]|nr:thioesterase domain-containing protein [Candidatus Thiodiazotropha taylori]